MQSNDYEIPEEKLKEWHEFLIHQTPGGLNYQMVASDAALNLIKAYRKQREEIERLRETIAYNRHCSSLAAESEREVKQFNQKL